MPRKSRRKPKNRKSISLPGGCAVDLPIQPRERTDLEDARQDHTMTAVVARLRVIGLPDTEINRNAVKSQMAGCNIGRAIMARGGREREALWQAVQHIRRVWVAYDRAIGLPSRHAKTASLMAASDAMLSADARPIDTRSADDKIRSAVSAKMAIHGWLAYSNSKAQSACIVSVVDEPEMPVKEWAGVRSALLCVADGLAGRRPVWRG